MAIDSAKSGGGRCHAIPFDVQRDAAHGRWRRPTQADSHSSDKFLHARLQGIETGRLRRVLRSTAYEEVQAGQPKAAAQWRDFLPMSGHRFLHPKPGQPRSTPLAPPVRKSHRGRIASRRIRSRRKLCLPKQIHAQARLECAVRESWIAHRLFRLSRAFRWGVRSSAVDTPVEFIRNPSLEGTELARQGNDFVAVVLPETYSKVGGDTCG